MNIYIYTYDIIFLYVYSILGFLIPIQSLYDTYWIVYTSHPSGSEFGEGTPCHTCSSLLTPAASAEDVPNDRHFRMNFKGKRMGFCSNRAPKRIPATNCVTTCHNQIGLNYAGLICPVFCRCQVVGELFWAVWVIETTLQA